MLTEFYLLLILKIELNLVILLVSLVTRKLQLVVPWHKKRFLLFLAGIGDAVYKISVPFWNEIRPGLIHINPVKKMDIHFRPWYHSREFTVVLLLDNSKFLMKNNCFFFTLF